MKKPALSNIERISDEINRHALRLAPQHGVAPDDAVRLLLEIVDLKDRDRIRKIPGINKKITQMIRDRQRSNQAAGDS